MRVHVDDEQCKGHGVCWSLCPDVFELTDDGYAVTLVTDVPDRHAEVVRTAVDQCPERAISITES
jgi:ferredoxin